VYFTAGLAGLKSVSTRSYCNWPIRYGFSVVSSVLETWCPNSLPHCKLQMNPRNVNIKIPIERNKSPAQFFPLFITFKKVHFLRLYRLRFTTIYLFSKLPLVGLGQNLQNQQFLCFPPEKMQSLSTPSHQALHFHFKPANPSGFIRLHICPSKSEMSIFI
jgi:hypothetical protein